MNPIVWLLLGGAGLAGISYLLKMGKTRTLPRLTSEDFLSLYKLSFTDPDELVLEQRSVIATHLGLPLEILSPEYSFERLARYAGFVGEYEVGMGDLETKLVELFDDTGLEKVEPFPSTVGELIHEFVRGIQKGGISQT